MPIQFRCEKCGHSIEVDDGLEGREGHCRHCGQTLVVPDRSPDDLAKGHATARTNDADSPLRLRPLAAREPPRAPAHLLSEPAPLNLRPVESGPGAPLAAAATASGPDSLAAAGLLDTRGPAAFEVPDPFRGKRPPRSSGPPSFLMILPTRIGRHVARWLVRMRDFLSIISAFALLAMLIGTLFKLPLMLHLGAAVIIAVNIGLLAVSAAYVVALPFKYGLTRGIACVLIPPYAIYFVATHWRQLRRPVRNTLQAFVPILLAGTAYFFYQEGPAIKATVEKELPPIEQKIEHELESLDPWSGHKTDPVKGPKKEP